MAKEIKLGQRARDVITGFEGIVLCTMQHLTGCNQVAILPQLTRTPAQVAANPGADEPAPRAR